MSLFITFFQNLWLMITESAPWLLLGFLIAGVINQLVPPKWITQSLGQKGFGNIFRAAIIGAPLPLCSCGVIPTAMGIRRAGATRGGTASFLVSTPETGVDSVSLTYALMGPVMAIARPISAIISAIMAGVLVEKLTQGMPDKLQESEKKSCCCGGKKNEVVIEPSPVEKIIHSIKSVVQFSFGKLLKDIAFWLAIGLVGAALIKTFIPPSFLTQWGSGIWAMLAMVAVGVPMYICATASTPLAASLVIAGISPGAALVFMLTGPATNIATLGVIKNELGGKSLLGYLIGVVVTAILMGLCLDFLLTSYKISMPLSVGHDHSNIDLLGTVSGLLLIGIVLFNYLPKSFSLFTTHQKA